MGLVIKNSLQDENKLKVDYVECINEEVMNQIKSKINTDTQYDLILIVGSDD